MLLGGLIESFLLENATDYFLLEKGIESFLEIYIDSFYLDTALIDSFCLEEVLFFVSTL